MAQVAQRHVQVQLRYLGSIPQDGQMEQAAQLRRPLLEVFPQAGTAQAFVELARNLMLLPATEKGGGNALNQVMQRLLQREPLQRILQAVR
jgi:MinD-like ATPase involved in chromosome partitioning or flagellar assembly